MIPFYGGDLRTWTQSVRYAIERMQRRLAWKRDDDNASEDGVFLWDDANGSVVVSRGAEFLQIVRWVEAPASASATGIQGDAAYDDDYLYVCTAEDTWLRVAIATW